MLLSQKNFRQEEEAQELSGIDRVLHIFESEYSEDVHDRKARETLRFLQ